jgi:hypothetical protein
MGTSRGILGGMTQRLPYTKADEDRLRAEAAMTEDEALEGALVPAPKPADIRYEDETPPDAVTKVIIRVERADGSVKEYEAREPQNWQMNDPESIGAQVLRPTGFGIGYDTALKTLMAGVPSLRLSFTAHPRHNLHIRNVRWPGGEPGPSQSSIPSASTSSTTSSPATTGKGS